MIDKSRPSPQELAEAGHQPPEFVPVPRGRIRHDGWTPERQRGFIEALMTTGSVKAAAHAVNMTPEGAYLLRRHAQAASFRDAWDQALTLGVQRLEDVAMERALHGEQVPVYSYGKLVGTRTVHNDRLLMFILRNRATDRFGAGHLRAGVVGSQHEARLKRQWRAEWQAELAAKAPTPAEIGASIERKLANLRETMEAQMSPATRELRRQYEEAYAEDKRRWYAREDLADD